MKGSQTTGRRLSQDVGGDDGPLYLQLVKELSDSVLSGRYPPGSRLPPEMELAKTYGVSRHTVREAMQRLRDIGMITRRAGDGTLVADREPKGRYVHSIGSLEAISQYTAETRLDVRSTCKVRVRGSLARDLECQDGSPWIHIGAVRQQLGSNPPLGWTDLYVRREFGGVLDRIGQGPDPVYKLIETIYGEEVIEVSQEIRAASIPAGLAPVLEVEADTPALHITRKYYNRNRRIFEVAFSLHPEDRFRYSITLKRTSGKRTPDGSF